MNRGEMEPIDPADLYVPRPSTNTKPRPKDIEADFQRAMRRFFKHSG